MVADSATGSRSSQLADGFCAMILRYGFMEEPDVAEILRSGGQALRARDRPHGHVVLPLPRDRGPERTSRAWRRWRDRVFAWMSRNGASATDYFNIPANRVVELGTQVEI